MRKHDCSPTLTDRQVLEFCAKGFLMLEGVVPEDINRKTCAFVDSDPGMEPNDILSESWFDEAVIKNPRAIGAV